MERLQAVGIILEESQEENLLTLNPEMVEQNKANQ